MLIINKVEKLPQLSLESILGVTTENILIGYIDEKDILHLPNNPRISFIDLTLIERISNFESSSGYVDFSRASFYKLVQYKWVLLKYAASLKSDYLIFSDFDVFWNSSPIQVLQDTFVNRPEINVQIQSYTSSPSREELCMGFVAFRNNDSLLETLEELSTHHRLSLSDDAYTGDDNVISNLYNSEMEFRSKVESLPQSTFPTGNLVNTFSTRNLFPGLTPYKPYIFHANFVIGTRKKILLLETFIHASQFGKRNYLPKLRVRMSLFILRFGVFIKNFRRNSLSK